MHSFLLPPAPSEQTGPVQAWSQPVEILTYTPAPADRNPMFLEKRLYQGSSGRVYPLPFTDRIATEPQMRSWQALHLENEYLRLMILPELGGRIHVGRPQEVAEQTGLFTRHGIERIARYGFEIASRRPRATLASATKSNALQHSMVLWDEVVEGVAKDFPTVSWRKYHVDAIAARMVTNPGTLDVILASNLFGDILTDLGAAVSGSLGIAPGANINPERRHPSMFEPIHGSAPDIAGKGIANPIGAIWAGALMLDHLGASDAADRVVRAIEKVLATGGPRTPDLGGRAATKDVTNAILQELT